VSLAAKAAVCVSSEQLFVFAGTVQLIAVLAPFFSTVRTVFALTFSLK
jgi:hypothetical protein